jgi:hypothetical protein
MLIRYENSGAFACFAHLVYEVEKKTNIRLARQVLFV